MFNLFRRWKMDPTAITGSVQPVAPAPAADPNGAEPVPEADAGQVPATAETAPTEPAKAPVRPLNDVVDDLMAARNKRDAIAKAKADLAQEEADLHKEMTNLLAEARQVLAEAGTQIDALEATIAADAEATKSWLEGILAKVGVNL